MDFAELIQHPWTGSNRYLVIAFGCIAVIVAAAVVSAVQSRRERRSRDERMTTEQVIEEIQGYLSAGAIVVAWGLGFWGVVFAFTLAGVWAGLAAIIVVFLILAALGSVVRFPGEDRKYGTGA